MQGSDDEIVSGNPGGTFLRAFSPASLYTVKQAAASQSHGFALPGRAIPFGKR